MKKLLPNFFGKLLQFFQLFTIPSNSSSSRIKVKIYQHHPLHHPSQPQAWEELKELGIKILTPGLQTIKGIRNYWVTIKPLRLPNYYHPPLQAPPPAPPCSTATTPRLQLLSRKIFSIIRHAEIRYIINTYYKKTSAVINLNEKLIFQLLPVVFTVIFLIVHFWQKFQAIAGKLEEIALREIEAPDWRWKVNLGKSSQLENRSRPALSTAISHSTQTPTRQYLFTVSEAAKFLGISADTLRNWEEKGKLIPQRTTGGARRYQLEQLKVILATKSPALAQVVMNSFKAAELTTPSTSWWATWFKPRAPRLAFATALVILVTIAISQLIAVSYLMRPQKTAQLFRANQSALETIRQSQQVLGTSTDLSSGTFNSFFSFILQPFNNLAVNLIQTLSPSKAKDLGLNQQKINDNRFSLDEKAILEIDDKIVQTDSILNQKISQNKTNITNLEAGLVSISTNLPQSIGYTDLIGKTIIDSFGNIYPSNSALTQTNKPALGTGSQPYYGLNLNNFKVDSTGNTIITGSLTAKSDVTLGATSANTVNILGRLSNDLIPAGNGTQSLGDGDHYWKNLYVNKITASEGGTSTWSVAGNLTTTATTFNFINDTATTINMGGSATTISLGSATGSTTVNNNLSVTGTTNLTGALTSTGGVLLPDGSSATPALRFTSDTDSGLYRLGTNTISLITGGTAGNGITIDSSGNLGVGTTAPNAALQVAGNINANTFNGNTITTGTGTLTLGASKTLTLSDSTTLNTNSITFAGTEVLTLAAAKDVTFADAFATSGSYSLTLTTTGTTNVTLPTTGTLSTLAGTETLSNKTFSGDTFFPSGIWATNGNIGIGTTVTSGGGLIVNQGDVGIGTTAPTYKLDVNGTARLGATQITGNVSASTGSLDIGTTGTRFGTIYADTVNATSLVGAVIGGYTDSADWTINHGNLTDDTTSMSLTFERGTQTPNAILGWDIGKQFTLNSGLAITAGIGTGNVGIGTTSPLGQLHVAGQCVTGDTMLRRRRRKLKNQKSKVKTEGGWDPDKDTSDGGSMNEVKADSSEVDFWEDVRIDQIQPGDEILTLDEKSGKFVVSRIKALQKMGVQDVFQLITANGKKIRTTGNHPYLAKKPTIVGPSGTFEADQSNRIEDLTKDSFIALSNAATGESFIASITKEEKRKAFKHYQKEPRFFGPILWARMIAYLIRKYSIHEAKIILDAEYPSYEKIIDQIIYVSGEMIFTEYQSIGRNSYAHEAVYEKATGKKLAHKKATGALTQYVQVAEDVLHPEFTGIRTPSDRLDKDYHKFDKLSIKQADWIKVYNLELGWDIATVNGWEKVISLNKVGREQVFDIEVEGTHNFVGNNIVAHNTIIMSGNLGIGTTAPLGNLQISGATQSQLILEDRSQSANAKNMRIYNYAGKMYIGTLNDAGSSGTDIITIQNSGAVANTLSIASGNIGIGTTSPSALLDVNGALKATTFNGNTITTGTGTLTLGASKTLTLSDSTTLNTNSITFAGTEVLTLAAAKDVTFADAFATSGSYSLTLTTTGTTNVTLPTTGTLSTLAGTETLSNKTFSGDTFFPSGIWATNGNIGIGTTTPGANTRLAIIGGNVGIGTTAPGALLDIKNGNINFGQVASPGAPSLAEGAAGNISGAVNYRITFVTATGETEGGSAAGITVTNKQIELTGIPIGPAGVTARKIYRGGGSLTQKLVTTLNDNTTQTYTDNTASGSLGAYVPGLNTTGGVYYINNALAFNASIYHTIFGLSAGAAGLGGGIYDDLFGYKAGNALTTGSRNAIFGSLAGIYLTTVNDNVAVGYTALGYVDGADRNTAVGSLAGRYSAGDDNTLLGYQAGVGTASYASNNHTFVGSNAGASITTGNDNTFIGYNSGKSNTTGGTNTFLGSGAGYSNVSGAGNVFLGYQAGYNETGSNKLYIANTNTSSPLIYGDFSSGNVGIGTTNPGNLLTVNGNMGIGTTAFVNARLAIIGGNVGIGTTDPTTSGYNLSVVGTGNFSGALTANTFNGNTITTGTGTLTLANSLITSGDYSLTLTTTGTTNVTLPTTGTLSTLAGTETLSNKTFSGDTFFPSGIWDTNGNIGIGTTAPAQKLDINQGNFRFSPLTAPTAPTVAINTDAGTLNGTYYYRITFVNALGETEWGTVSSAVAPVDQQVNLSGIPLGATGTTSRKIYRTKASTAASQGVNANAYLVATIADNTTTTYTDNIADGSLGAAANFTNTTGTGLYTGTNKSILFTVAPKGETPVQIGAADTALYVAKTIDANGPGSQYAARYNVAFTTNSDISTLAGGIRAFSLEFYKYGTGRFQGNVYGGKQLLGVESASQVDTIIGESIGIRANAAGSIISNAYHFIVEQRTLVGTITNKYGFYSEDISADGTNTYPLYIKNQATTGTNNWAIYVAGGKSIFNAGTATLTPLTLKGASSQTANLQEWQDSSGNVLAVVNNNGNVGIGTTAPTAQLELSGDTAIKSSGTTWANPSDVRLKDIVGDYNYGLDKISQINPVIFTFKDDNALGIVDPGEHVGIIAQQLQQVIPEAVSAGSQGYLKVNIDPVIWATVNAVKELNTQIATMRDALKIEADGTINVSAIKTDKLLLADTSLSETGLSTSDSSLVTVETEGYSQPVTQTQYQEAVSSINNQISRVNDLENRVKALEDKLAAQIVYTEASRSAQLASSPLSATQSATPSSVLTMNDERITNSDLHLTPPDLLLATTSAQLVELRVTSEATFSGQLTAYQATISDTFKSLGDTVLGNTIVAGSFSVDGTLSFTGSSISNLSTLYIQNSPLGQSVDFFNGEVVIDKSGTLEVKKIKLPAEVLGEATVPAGQKEIPVFTKAVTNKSRVFLTPLTHLGGQSIIVSGIIPGSGFVASLDQSLNTDVKFNWVILDSSN